jgi:hypothetical protein
MSRLLFVPRNVDKNEEVVISVINCLKKGPHTVALLTEESRDVRPCSVEILRRGLSDNLSTVIS